MTETWVTRRSVRFVLAGSSLLIGFLVALLLLHQAAFALATAIFSIGLAGLIGAGKLASP